jgi:hypothetical protein
MIISTFRDNKKLLSVAFSKNLATQKHERLSTTQSKLLDTAEKQNLKNLKYDDNAIHRRNMLIPQVRPAHKYPNSPWEMIHPPGGDNAVCM